MGKYLGVPLTGRVPRKSDFNYLVEKVRAKLASWKTKQLSLAGRITLAKSVIEAIATYPIMSCHLPINYLDEIQKMQCAFISGGKIGARKLHHVGWHTILLPIRI